MRQREARHDAIREIVRGERIERQRQLHERLAEAGYSCTQGTISRDVADLGLEKSLDGAYMLPEDLHVSRLFAELVTDVVAAENLVVVKSGAGAAQGVAAALDAAEIEGIVGSIAGDDTILLVAESKDGASALVAGLERYRS